MRSRDDALKENDKAAVDSRALRCPAILVGDVPPLERDRSREGEVHISASEGNGDRTTRGFLKIKFHPQIRRENPLIIRILHGGGKENSKDSRSSGE